MYASSQSARIAKNDFETEGSVPVSVSVRGMVKARFFRALIESLSVSASNSSECQYSAV